LSEPEDPAVTSFVQGNPQNFQCPECPESFLMPYQLKYVLRICSIRDKTYTSTHMKKHTKPFKCGFTPCGQAFRYKKDLTRHRASKHPELVGNAGPLFCPFEGCKYGVELGRGFPGRTILTGMLGAGMGVLCQPKDQTQII
jgi:hypothetical protein